MKVIIAWDGDHIGREVGRASLADDVDGLRRISQAIDLGNNVWKSWVVMNAGSIISMGGDEGRAEIAAEKLSELPRIRDQYAQAVSATVSVGVGTKLSEADRALLVAKLRGGDRIVLYSEDIEPEIEAAEKQKVNTTEAEKLSDEYLGKADPGQAPESPAAAQPTAAGFQPAAPAIDPGNDQQDGGPPPAQDAGAAQETGAQPAPQGDPGEDFEEAFHGLAEDQQKKDQGDPEKDASSDDQLKAQVVQILQQLKEQAPILEQVKQSAPDTYQAVMNMAQAVIAMARKLNGDPANQTGAKELKDRAKSDAQVQVPLPPEDGDDKDKKDDTKKSEDLTKNKPTPKFPKLGLPDDRRETPIVTTPRELTIKGRAMANAQMNAERYSKTKVGALPLKIPKGVTPEQVWDDWTSPEYSHLRAQVRSMIAPGMAGAAGAANATGPTTISYSKGTQLRPEANDPFSVSNSSSAPTATKLHEDLHLMMQRIQHKYGEEGRRNVIANMMNELDRRDPSAAGILNSFAAVRNSTLSNKDALFNEEKMASLLNYLNSPKERELFHQHLQHTPEDVRLFDGAMKRAHRHLQEMGQSDVVPTWALQAKHLKATQPRRRKPVAKSEKAYKLEGDAVIEVDPKTGKSLGKGPMNKDEKPAKVNCDEIGHSWGTGAAAGHCLACKKTKTEVEEMAKASLSPNAGAPAAHHHLQLPVGSKIDPTSAGTARAGRIKVTHTETGKQGWVSARAGQVLSQDGHPISAKNPNGK